MMSSPDIRAYYGALGIEIAGWARTEAPVRCFANPDAHRRGDRDPSCSINLEHGAWHCHGCGAHGGAFDAALVRGYGKGQAIELMASHGLVERRALRNSGHRTPGRAWAPCASERSPSRLQLTEDEIAHGQAALAGATDLIARLTRERGWLYAAMLELQLGVDRGRITIPARDHRDRLIGLLRYQPWPRTGEPKMLATAGSRRSLVPHPTRERSRQVLLVEGEPDMIAARSHGLPAIALPGVHGWQRAWAPLLASREVTIVMDCDAWGRSAAARIEADLQSASEVHVLDLAPQRDDGYDLTNWLQEGRPSGAVAISEAFAATTLTSRGNR